TPPATPLAGVVRTWHLATQVRNLGVPRRASRRTVPVARHGVSVACPCASPRPASVCLPRSPCAPCSPWPRPAAARLPDRRPGNLSVANETRAPADSCWAQAKPIGQCESIRRTAYLRDSAAGVGSRGAHLPRRDPRSAWRREHGCATGTAGVFGC